MRTVRDNRGGFGGVTDLTDLVDANLRRPSIAEYLGLGGEVGLTTVLIGQAEVEDAIQPWGNGSLHVLPSGQVPPNPSELLGSRSMANMLEQLTSTYDIVLIDTPPTLPVTDAAILAKITGGALVVAAAGNVHRQQFADGLGALEDMGARVLGVVLNRLAHKQNDAYSYYDYAPAPASGAKDKSHQTRAARSTPTHTRTSRIHTRRSWSLSNPNKAAETEEEQVRVHSTHEDNS